MSNLLFLLRSGSRGAGIAALAAAISVAQAQEMSSAPGPSAGQASQSGTLADDAEMEIRSMGDEGTARLQALTGGELPNASATMSASEFSAMAKWERRVRRLQRQIHEAELAVKLRALLGDDETVADEAATDGDTATAASVAIAPQPEPLPVVASVIGAGMNVSAVVLVPYAGEVTVRPGDTLANGMKVESISPSGVTVRDGHRAVVLGFGTSVPRYRSVDPALF